MNSRVTIKHIAKKANVSIGTVDRVIHNRGRVDANTSAKVNEAIREMNYKTNKLARVLSKNESIKIALVTPGHNYFFKDIISGAQKACKQMLDYNIQLDLITQDNEKKPMDQLLDFEKTVEKGYNGIIVSPLHPYLFCEAINKAISKEITIITVNRDSKESGRICYVGHNLYHEGILAGRIYGRFMRGIGKAAILSGFQEFSPFKERQNGFSDIINKEYPGIKLTDTYQYADNPDIAFEISKMLINNDPEINGIFADTTTGTIGIGKAIEELMKNNQIIATGYDEQSEIIDLLEKNALIASITQNQFSQGYNAMLIMKNVLIDKNMPSAAQWYAKTELIFHKEQINANKERELYSDM